ncbi:TPA: YfiR family protein, partial [Candidatus Poribacteria bacterium]|nr:YfiR family protein [Candidatus Poribacteria bacterium]
MLLIVSPLAFAGTKFTLNLIFAPAVSTKVMIPPAFIKLSVSPIVNFVKLTEWPSNVAIFEVGVYKDPEFATLLTAMLAGKKVRGKDVKVTPQDDASLFANCHVIFLPKSVEGELGDVFGKIKDLGDTPANPAKLTIGETD